MFQGEFKNGNEYLVVCKDGELIDLNTNSSINTWMTIELINGNWAWVMFDNVDGERLNTLIHLYDLRYYIEDESAFNS